eukprot:ctg_2464.g761
MAEVGGRRRPRRTLPPAADDARCRRADPIGSGSRAIRFHVARSPARCPSVKNSPEDHTPRRLDTLLTERIDISASCTIVALVVRHRHLVANRHFGALA